jgi:L-ribulose-5-phosphate 3-epimerase
MLRLACMSLSYQRAFNAGQMDLFSYIEESRRLDLDGVDLHGAHFISHDTDYLLLLKRACLKRGLTIACVSIPNNFAFAPDRLEGELAKTRQLIDDAHYLGAPLVRVFAGWSDNQDEGTWGRVLDCLRQSAEYGESRGVAVALQNHNHNGVAATGEKVLQLLADVDHPNLAHVMDTGQYLDPYASMPLTVDRAVHVRTKIYEIETGEERRLDYSRIFPILRRANYNGFLSIVYEGVEDERAAIAKAVPYLRRMMAVS